MKRSQTLLIATHNKGKLRELRKLLAGVPLAFSGLDDFPSITAVQESGKTFAENASLKATGYAKQTGLLTLADDSGLEVDVLCGRPGVLSARYAGEGASDQERTAKLLAELANVPIEERSARFVSSVAIASEDGKVLHVSNGACEGRIAFAPKGAGGFGYDPIFLPDGHKETFGELGPEVKNRISHRAQALMGARKFLGSLTIPATAR